MRNAFYLQLVEGAFHVFQGLLRHINVPHRGLNIAVAKQILYVADVRATFEQMRGVTVPIQVGTR